MLATVGVVLVLTYVATKWIAARGLPGVPGGHGNGSFQLLGQMSIGRNERLLLVQVGTRCLLLGVTANAVTCLLELTEEEVRQWQQESEYAPPSFLETLQKNLRRKK